MTSHTLTYNEIISLPPGRILNTLIAEYVLGDVSKRWSNGQQKEVDCHWFDGHPRACAEDDGGFCNADGLPDYSGDVSRAMGLAMAPRLKDNVLHTKADQGRFEAAFSPTGHTFVSGPTLAVAICRAALIAV
jgi:hypothetical protein